jgi:hypothetical protein
VPGSPAAAGAGVGVAAVGGADPRDAVGAVAVGRIAKQGTL